MVVGAALVFLYWTLAMHGVVPSPNRPLRAGPAATGNLSNQVPFHAATEPPPQPSAPSSPPADAVRAGAPNPAEDAVPKTGSSAALRPTPAAVPVNPVAVAPTNGILAAVTNRPPEAAAHAKPIPTNAPAPPANTPSPLALPATTQQDENVARCWAASTNARPVVRVSYVGSDIIELLRVGRGVLVASSGNEAEKKRREFVLASLPSANPEYVAFTAHHASRFAKFGIALHKEGELARLSAPLAAYFGGTAESVTLEFVPDQVLGQAIYTQVSRSSRAANVPLDQQNGWVYEGELRLEAGQPEFTIQRVRAAGRNYLFAPAR